MKKGRFLRALSVFLGTTIGVGIFGLPFVAFKAGFLIVFLYLVIASFLVALLLYIYGRVAIHTEGLHRLPGYVGKYLGLKWERATFFVVSLGLLGTLLAYLVIGGGFLDSLFGDYLGHNVLVYTLFFFALASYLLFRGIKSVSGIEFILFLILLIILAVFFVKAFPFIDKENFGGFDLNSSFLPYGVVLFALTSSAVIPEIKEMIVLSLKKRDNNLTSRELKKIVTLGMLIVLSIYIFFIVIVLGASGSLTSKDAISGLEKTLDNGFVKLGFAFGVISCFTSFLTLGLAFKKMLLYDLKVQKHLSWAITCFTPLILFLLGLRRFIEIIGFTGAVAVGAEGIIIVFLYRAFLRKKLSSKMNPFYYTLIVVFFLGIVSQIVKIFY